MFRRHCLALLQCNIFLEIALKKKQIMPVTRNAALTLESKMFTNDWLPCLHHHLLLHLHYPDAREGGFGPVKSLSLPHGSRVCYNKQVNYIFIFLLENVKLNKFVQVNQTCIIVRKHHSKFISCMPLRSDKPSLCTRWITPFSCWSLPQCHASLWEVPLQHHTPSCRRPESKTTHIFSLVDQDRNCTS